MIKKLPIELINKIAAGEVVERPASIVKELVENAIDAGADQITVEVKNGGIDYIRVSDSGRGMSKEDAEIALERHTTSKITAFEDLYNLETMGFRGEALSSISAVSDFTLETKMHNELGGTKITTNGTLYNCETSSCDTGTVITVENLFGNVPARKKFLKTSSTEYNNIIETFTQYALYYHNISWKLIHNDIIAINAAKTHHKIDRVKQILGVETGNELISIAVQGSIKIEGFVGKPNIFKSNKKFQFTYVNGRPIHDHVVSKAVQDAFGSVSINRLYPVFMLDITLPHDLVDVNVHPRKTEVRFKDHNEVYRLVKATVKNALVQNNVLTSTDLIQSFASSSSKYEAVDHGGILFKPKHNMGSSSTPTTPQFVKHSLHNSSQPSFNTSQIATTLGFSESIARMSSQQESTLHNLDDWKLVGQIHNSYILVETKDGFLVVDQHAAAERLNYERLTAEYAKQNKKIQPY